MSYTATLKVVQQLSELQKLPLLDWLSDGAVVKYNVDKRRRVRDIRSDHQSKMHNMYSILVTKGLFFFQQDTNPCDIAIQEAEGKTSADAHSTRLKELRSLPATSFLPSREDLIVVRQSIKVLIARILRKYIVCLTPLSKQVPTHISHEHSESMALKSEVFFVDILMKNEAVHTDMVDIMVYMQDLLGKDVPSGCKVLSGGDQLTCEQQANAQRHRMDGDSIAYHLQLLEPICEDWHALCR